MGPRKRVSNVDSSFVEAPDVAPLCPKVLASVFIVWFLAYSLIWCQTSIPYYWRPHCFYKPLKMLTNTRNREKLISQIYHITKGNVFYKALTMSTNTINSEKQIKQAYHIAYQVHFGHVDFCGFIFALKFSALTNHRFMTRLVVVKAFALALAIQFWVPLVRAFLIILPLFFFVHSSSTTCALATMKLPTAFFSEPRLSSSASQSYLQIPHLCPYAWDNFLNLSITVAIFQ